MLKIDLSFYSKARVWLEDLPEVNKRTDKIEEFIIQTKSAETTSTKKVAVELNIPKGGRTLYGLLGATYTPDTNNELKIRIGEVYKPEIEISADFIQPFDTVYSGMLHEYTPGIYMGALEASHYLKSGSLFFNCCLHNNAGSSIHIFQQLTNIIITLMALEPSSEKEIRELIVNVLRRK